MGLVERLLVLLAVLLMPVGMESAASAAPATDHHTMMAGMPMGHCPDQSNKHEHNDGLATCSMACASALPAQELLRDETPLRHYQLVMPMVAQMLHGMHPEIPTPPPRLT